MMERIYPFLNIIDQMKKCFALLIGINEYKGSSLFQCVADVEKMETYCQSLKAYFDTLYITTLLNEQATKIEIVKAIQAIINQLTNKDTFLIYFSGHGAQENNKGRFAEEADDLLECLVCYYERGQESGYLLADKELSYLLTTCKANPHILTVFDCCHSGDMLRSEKRIKRMSHIFPARTYKEFLFAEAFPEKDLTKKRFNERFLKKNSIHLSACQSNQAAWEGEIGGFFTNYLLQLLKRTNNQVSYYFLVQWAKLTIKNITPDSQIPTIGVQGEGKLSAQTNWLGIYEELIKPGSQLVHNAETGWQITVGQLMGISEGTGLKVILDDKKEITTSVTTLGIDYARIELSQEQEGLLDTKKNYPIIISSLYQPLLM